MAANAIYFPYINVPPDPWLMRMLSYWDRLNSIVPMDYQEAPALFENKMRELVAAGLVTPIAPGQYLGDLGAFAASFLRFAENWNRRGLARSEAIPRTLIHIEKLEGLVQPLVEMDIARWSHGPWYEMPSPVANRFMVCLAAALGQVPAIDAAPVTNSAPFGQSLRATGLATKREALLEVLFPVPHGSEKLTLDHLVKFKAKHQALTAKFRERLEDECIALADGDTHEERREHLDALGRKLQNEVAEISEAMKGHWQKVFLARLAPVLAAVLPLADADPRTQVATYGGAALTAGLSLYQGRVLQAADDAVKRRPLAYVALARQQIPAFRTKREGDGTFKRH